MPSRARYRSSAGLARFLRWMLLVTAAVAAVATAAALLAGAETEHPGGLPIGGPAQLEAVWRFAFGASMAALVATALAWFGWSARVVSNARALGTGEGAVGPAGAIGWWFVPVANLFVPMATMLGLSRRLSLDERPTRDLLIVAWWLAFVGSGLALAMGTVELVGARSGQPHLTAASHLGWAFAGWAIAALLAYAVVRTIQGAEAARASQNRARTTVLPNTLASLGSARGSGSLTAGAAVGAASSLNQVMPNAIRAVIPVARVSPVTGPPDPTAVPGWPGTRDIDAPPWGSPKPARSSGGRLSWVIGAIVAFAILAPQLPDLIGGFTSQFGAATPRPTVRVTARPTSRPSPRPTPRPTVASEPSPVALATPTPIAMPTPETHLWTFQPSPTPGPPQDGAQALASLRRHLAKGDGRCRAIAPPDFVGTEVAALSCDAKGSTAVTSLIYRAYGRKGDAIAAYNELVAKSRIPRDSGDCFDSGRAGEEIFWATDEGAVDGHVLCQMLAGDAGRVPAVDWIDLRFGIVGQARGRAGHELAEIVHWWRDESGPA